MKKLNLKFHLIIGLVILILVSACGSNPKEDSENRYLSLTLTYQVGEREFKSDIITIDLDTEEAELRATIPYERDYPIGVFSVGKNTLYYSSLSDKNPGNQIFSLNLDTNEKIQLTDDVAYVSDIRLINKNEILVNTVRRNADDIAVQPAIINLKDGKEKSIFPNNEMDVRASHVRYDKNDIIFSARNMKDFRERLDLQQYDIEYSPGTAYIYSYKKDDLKLLEDVDGIEIVSLQMSDNGFTLLDDELDISCLETGVLEPCQDKYLYGRNHYYDEKADVIYSISSNKVIKYDVQKDEIYDVYDPEYEFFSINNMTYVEE